MHGNQLVKHGLYDSDRQEHHHPVGQIQSLSYHHTFFVTWTVLVQGQERDRDGKVCKNKAPVCGNRPWA